jgi:hypothetical protein
MGGSSDSESMTNTSINFSVKLNEGLELFKVEYDRKFLFSQLEIDSLKKEVEKIEKENTLLQTRIDSVAIEARQAGDMNA